MRVKEREITFDRMKRVIILSKNEYVGSFITKKFSYLIFTNEVIIMVEGNSGVFASYWVERPFTLIFKDWEVFP